jgi:site-specific recombinase XerD
VGSKVKTVGIGQIEDLLPSWTISLQAAGKPPATVYAYTSAMRLLDEFLEPRGMPTAVASIRKEHVEAFLAWMAKNYKPASCRNRYTGFRRFFAWCLEEGEVTESPMRNIDPSPIPENPPPVLTEDQLRALLKACSGSTFEDRRDTAIVTLFLDAVRHDQDFPGSPMRAAWLSPPSLAPFRRGRGPLETPSRSTGDGKRVHW